MYNSIDDYNYHWGFVPINESVSTVPITSIHLSQQPKPKNLTHDGLINIYLDHN